MKEKLEKGLEELNCMEKWLMAYNLKACRDLTLASMEYKYVELLKAHPRRLLITFLLKRVGF